MRMSRFGALIGLGLCVVSAGCSAGAGGGDGTGGGGTAGGPGSGAGSSGGGGSSGQSGPGGTAAGGFMVHGRVASLPALGGLHTLDAPGGGTTAKRVTHVMGVTPSSQSTRRVVSQVAADGTFSLDLDPARLWVLVFVDATKVGSDMVVGVFRAKGLDTLAPTKKGSADLGDVTAKDGAADGSIPYDDLLAAMGVDPTSALFLSSIDDMCLRVVNPDVDGNGKIDALEPGSTDYRLDFHVQFAMQIDHAVSVDDLVGAFLPDTVTLRYGGTGIYASFMRSQFPAGWEPSRWASFDEDVHYAPLGGMGPGNPLVTHVGTNVAAADLSTSGYGEYASVGLMASPGFDMPQGSYRFGIGPTTLTFTNVRTATDSQLQAAESFIMPFVRLVKTDPSCTTACAISTIDYEWRKRTDAGWVNATAGEIALVAGEQGGFLSIRLGNDPLKNIGFMIPKETVTGTIPWGTAMTTDAATKAAAVNATTSDLCHVGLSYDDKLGMRYFGAIGDAPGTCPMP